MSLAGSRFFASGACHVLACAFLERHFFGAKALWLRPEAGIGNHVFVARGDWAFNFHGYALLDRCMTHSRRRAQRLRPGWHAQLVELPREVLVSEAKSRTYDGLWLREPGQFMHNALPRARVFLNRFPVPELWRAQAFVATGGPSGKPHSDHEPS